MSQTTNELRACPFCGGAATAETYVVEAWVGCRTCHIGATRRHGQFDDTGLPEAISAWNVRHEQAQGGMADGWIPWSGGECPVDPDTRVDVRLRLDGEVLAHLASDWDWAHDDSCDPILAYRPTADARQETQG